MVRTRTLNIIFNLVICLTGSKLEGRSENQVSNGMGSVVNPQVILQGITATDEKQHKITHQEVNRAL